MVLSAVGRHNETRRIAAFNPCRLVRIANELGDRPKRSNAPAGVRIGDAVGKEIKDSAGH
jgi:hypothetical protein